MSFFVKSTVAPTAKTSASKQVAILYAAILSVIVVAQLFTFEEFIQVILSLGLPIQGALLSAVAPMIVAFGVFALPFLLRMDVSPAFRRLSMACGWLVAACWLGISLWVVLTSQPVLSIGFLGGLVELAPGAWSIFISAALGVLALWSSWGLWSTKVKK